MEIIEDEIRLSRPEGEIAILPMENGLHRVTLLPADPEMFIPIRARDTMFPPELISFMAEKLEYAWLCDSIARQEDPSYVAGVLERQLFSYFPRSAFVGKRILDFGCGTGSSTFAMAEMLPRTEVVGVELSQPLVDVARKIAEFRQLPNAKFLQSPDGESLPQDVGTFDYVMLCAVYEHLLPQERQRLMPKLWAVMRAGSVMFVNQTPHRYFPYEHHSSGLWMINYLPDGLAHLVTRTLARRRLQSQCERWEDLLRGGIRGGTEPSILRDLCGGRTKAASILQPHQRGLRDRADYWLACTGSESHRRLKQVLASLFRLCDRYLSTVPSTNVDVAVRKEYSNAVAKKLQPV